MTYTEPTPPTEPTGHDRVLALHQLTVILERLQPTCRLLAEALETAREEPGPPSYRHFSVVQYLAGEAINDLADMQATCWPLRRAALTADLLTDSEGGEL